MNPMESVILTRYVRAMCPQQKFDEFTADVWHDLLSGYELDEARAAAVVVGKRQPFVSPSEIIAAIRSRRGENARDIQGPGLPAEIPDADPDDVPAYLAAVRNQRTRAADGEELKPRAVAELLARVGQPIPKASAAERTAADQAEEADELAEVRRSGPLGQHCPDCDAPVGRPCRMGTAGRPRASSHRSRRDAALIAAGHQPEARVSLEEIERRKAASAAVLAALPPDASVAPQDGFHRPGEAS